MAQQARNLQLLRDCQWRLGLWPDLEVTLRSPAPPHSTDAAMIRAYSQVRAPGSAGPCCAPLRGRQRLLSTTVHRLFLLATPAHCHASLTE